MSHNLSPNYWNERYLSDNFGWDAGEITTPLKNYFDQLNDKGIRILIPGAGNAYEAEYLVNNGFENVYVCDFAPAPLTALKKRCPKINDTNLLLCDFFDLSQTHAPVVNDGFDLIVEQTFFCAIHPTLRGKYVQKMKELLKPHGKLVGLLFDEPLNSDQPPFGGNRSEYLTHFQTHFNIHTLDASYNSIKPREGRELFINLRKKNDVK